METKYAFLILISVSNINVQISGSKPKVSFKFFIDIIGFPPLRLIFQYFLLYNWFCDLSSTQLFCYYVSIIEEIKEIEDNFYSEEAYSLNEKNQQLDPVEITEGYQQSVVFVRHEFSFRYSSIHLANIYWTNIW